MDSLIPPTVNLLILVLVLVYFLRDPIKKMVADRHLSIKAQVEDAQAQKLEAERKLAEFSQKLSAFEVEAKTMLERARTDGEALKAKIVAEAKVSAKRIIDEAQATVEANVQDYKDQIRRETIAQAIAEAEKIIREGLSMDDHRRIVNEYVGKVQLQ